MCERSSVSRAGRNAQTCLVPPGVIDKRSGALVGSGGPFGLTWEEAFIGASFSTPKHISGLWLQIRTWRRHVHPFPDISGIDANQVECRLALSQREFVRI